MKITDIAQEVHDDAGVATSIEDGKVVLAAPPDDKDKFLTVKTLSGTLATVTEKFFLNTFQEVVTDTGKTPKANKYRSVMVKTSSSPFKRQCLYVVPRDGKRRLKYENLEGASQEVFAMVGKRMLFEKQGHLLYKSLRQTFRKDGQYQSLKFEKKQPIRNNRLSYSGGDGDEHDSDDDGMASNEDAEEEEEESVPEKKDGDSDAHVRCGRRASEVAAASGSTPLRGGACDFGEEELEVPQIDPDKETECTTTAAQKASPGTVEPLKKKTQSLRKRCKESQPEEDLLEAAEEDYLDEEAETARYMAIDGTNIQAIGTPEHWIYKMPLTAAALGAKVKHQRARQSCSCRKIQKPNAKPSSFTRKQFVLPKA